MIEDIISTLSEIPSLEYFWECLGLLVVLIAALVIWRALMRRMRGIRVFDNASGHVAVSRSALTDLVQTSCRAIGARNNPSVHLYTKRGKINVSVHLKLEAGQRLTDISTRIQDHLTETLQNTLGVERIGSIDVRVTGFKPATSSDDDQYSPLKPFAKDTTIREVESTGDIGGSHPWFSKKDDKNEDEEAQKESDKDEDEKDKPTKT